MFVFQGLDVNESTVSGRAYKRIDKLYAEFNNQRQLYELNQNIDVRRFESDQVYRTETILGLSDSLDTFRLACSLAKFYSLDLWDVYMSFARNLFLEHAQLGIGLDDLETHLKPLVGVLHRKLDRFATIMHDDVFTTIDGRDLDKLATYFTILNDASSQAHVKLIRKLKSVDFTNGFDYKVSV